MKSMISEDEIYLKLKEAEREAENSNERYSSEDILMYMRLFIKENNKLG